LVLLNLARKLVSAKPSDLPLLCQLNRFVERPAGTGRDRTLTGSQLAIQGLALLLVGVAAGVVIAMAGGKPIIPKSVPIIWRLMIMFLGMVLIALAVDLIIKLSVDSGADRWMVSGRWWLFAMITGGMFGLVVRGFRPSWTQHFFWLTLAGLLTTHLAVWTIPMLRTSEWGTGLLMPATVTEGVLIVWLLIKLGFHPGAAKL
jgi:hypothetical protein